MSKVYRFISLCVLCFSVAACSSIQLPSYIKDQHPYSYKIYAPYGETLTATRDALAEQGWQIQSVSDPTIFEHNKATYDPTVKQVLLITKIKNLPLFLGTRYARMNVYLTSSGDKATDLEIRYLTVNSILFGSFNNYKHPIAVENLHENIQQRLK